MYNAAFLTKCFDSIYYLQQGATRWRLKKHTEGSMMPCRFRRRLWKMWTNISASEAKVQMERILDFDIYSLIYALYIGT